MSQIGLAFDFDGVILDSEPTKLHAFASIFSDYPHALERITVYNANQRGVPRAEKIRYICEHILACPDCDAAVDLFLKRYAAALQRGLAQAALVPGIIQVLEHTPFPKYVCSSAPLEEVAHLLSTHQLTHHFTRIFGSPEPKTQALQRLKQVHQTLIFFGDAIADYQAAQATHTAFIGVVSAATRDRFRGLDIPLVEQFGDVATIHALIAQLAEREARQ